MKDQRYRVFIAHDVGELQDTAVALGHELLKHKCLPLGLGLKPSSANNHWDIIRAMIDESDAVFLVIGNSYGNLSPSGVSYVHMAYIYATTQGKVIYPFCLKTLSDKKANDAHIEEFRKLLSVHKIRFWCGKEDLNKQLLMAVRKLKSLQQIGLVPAGAEVKEKAFVPPVINSSVTTTTLQNQEIAKLKKELEETKRELSHYESYSNPNGASNSASNKPKLRNKFVLISYSAKVFSGGNFKTITESWNMSWDDIFLAVAPHMLTAISEEKMRLVISAALATHVQAPIKQQYPNSHAVADVRLTNESMNRVKIYLRGQDLIQEVMQGRDIRWKLTDIGDEQLTELYSNQSLARSV